MNKHLANVSAVHFDNDSFVESNLKHSIIGFLYGNLKGLNMKVGEKVRWYMRVMGTEVDIHAPH